MNIKIKCFRKGKKNSYTLDFVGNYESIVLYATKNYAKGLNSP